MKNKNISIALGLAAAACLSFVAQCPALADQASASTPASTEPQTAAQQILMSSFALLIAIAQLVVGLFLVAFGINTGIKILTKILSSAGAPIDIWTEIKNKNVAVALLGAGVVFSYINVIASGVESMTKAITGMASFKLKLWDGVANFVGGAVNLLVALAAASFAITVVFKVMDRLTTTIDEKEEFKNNNIAIGVLYCGILVGVSTLVSSAVSGVGQGVATLLASILGTIGI